MKGDSPDDGLRLKPLAPGGLVLPPHDVLEALVGEKAGVALEVLDQRQQI
jgi:hypothetical protein